MGNLRAARTKDYLSAVAYFLYATHSTLHIGPPAFYLAMALCIMAKYHETHLGLPAVLYIIFKLLEKLPTSAKYRTNGAYCTVQYVSASIRCFPTNFLQNCGACVA